MTEDAAQPLQQLLEEATVSVAATLPPARAAALLALLRAGDAVDLAGDAAPVPRPGWNLALRLCLEGRDGEGANLAMDYPALAGWAAGFLADCDRLALAGLALAQFALGHLHLQQHAPGAFVAWPASRRLSTEERERADFDWWSAHLTRQAAPRLAPLLAERSQIRALLGQGSAPARAAASYLVNDPAVDRYYCELGQAYVARFSCQHSYPDDAAIGGATFRRYSEILALLIGWLHRECDRRAPESDSVLILDEGTMIATLAVALDTAPEAIRQALQPFILDRQNAAYHSALPGRASAPLIRLDGSRVVCSARGLLGEPLIFLARELRRRYAQQYHNSAHLREGVFRQDLYRLFGDKRFDLSPGPVVLKRSGQPRTDLDALIFDRKTGTLGVFELKAQDPFARSVEERQRQRDSFYHANHQVSAILEWVQRHGADDLLVRFAERTAKRFHVQKVYVFVLGRYLAHFTSGPEPDRRAAWGSWPQVLQLVEQGSCGANQRNPLGALFTRLRDAPPLNGSDNTESQAISVGGLSLRMFPSFAAMRSAEDQLQASS